MSATIRKPSWEYADLSWKIDTSHNADGTPNPCKLPAKLLLCFLGKCANNKGESWHGYKSIRSQTTLSNDSISNAARYLESELKILQWAQGGGTTTNRYRLCLETMRSLADDQPTIAASRCTGNMKIPPQRIPGPTLAAHHPTIAAGVSDISGVPSDVAESNPKEPSVNHQKATPTEPGPRPAFPGDSSAMGIQDSNPSATHPSEAGEAPALRHLNSGTVPQAPSLSAPELRREDVLAKLHATRQRWVKNREEDRALGRDLSMAEQFIAQLDAKIVAAQEGAAA